MQNQVKVEVCKKCKGQGSFPSTGKMCDECRGIGLIGTDGTYEYYLGSDGKGGLRIEGIKSQISAPQISASDKKTLLIQKRTVTKMLLFLLFIILYGGFIGIYVSWIKDPKVFWVVTIFTAGFLLLFLFSKTELLNNIVKFITSIFFKEPYDFLSAVYKRGQRSEQSPQPKTSGP